MSETASIDTYALEIARETWDTFRRDPALFVIASGVSLLVSLGTLGVLAGPVTVGYVDLVRKVRAGEPVAVSVLFSRMDTLVSSGVALFLFMLLTWLGMMLLVVPGLLAILFFSFAIPAIAFEGVGGIDGLRRSAVVTRAHFLETLVLLLMLSALHALGSALIVGLLLSMPLGSIALTVGYERLRAPTPSALVV